MSITTIIDPRTDQPVAVEALARETGLPRYVLLHRWDIYGIRGMSLLAPGSKFQRHLNKMTQRQLEAFLINNLSDSEHYYLDTGEVVTELLEAELTWSSL